MCVFKANLVTGIKCFIFLCDLGFNWQRKLLYTALTCNYCLAYCSHLSSPPRLLKANYCLISLLLPFCVTWISFSVPKKPAQECHRASRRLKMLSSAFELDCRVFPPSTRLSLAQTASTTFRRMDRLEAVSMIWRNTVFSRAWGREQIIVWGHGAPIHLNSVCNWKP